MLTEEGKKYRIIIETTKQKGGWTCYLPTINQYYSAYKEEDIERKAKVFINAHINFLQDVLEQGFKVEEVTEFTK